jgi:Ca-activated chloride channel family protein
MRFLARACLILAILRPASPQILLNPPPKPDVIRVDVELVNVLCSVRDKHGAYVKDLRKEDFELRVDGHPRPITNFAPEVASPLTVALLLDVSGSVAAVLPDEKAAAGRFFAQVLRPGDKALLAGFSGLIAVWQDLTPSVENVQAALARAGAFEYNPDQRLETQPRGGTLLFDAVTLVAENKLKPLTGRKTMVLITDGEDNGSIADSKKAVRAAQEADAVIYGIRYQDHGFGMRFGTIGLTGIALDTGLGTLVRLAEPTGGRAFDAMRDTSLEAIFHEISEEMRDQYGLAFTPAEQAGKGEFHKLEIRLKRPGLKAQARSGYYR